MSIQIGEVPELEANLVAASIHYTGEANTKAYYTPSKTESDGVPVSYYRGCKFIGQHIDLGDDTGYVVAKSESLSAGEHGEDYKIVNNYTAVAKFNKFTVYGHDRLPAPTDKYRLIGEWKVLSSIIHAD